MGLEGAVKAGYRKELEAVQDTKEREALYEKLLAQMYEKGKAINMATYLEIDAVIDPADTRKWIMQGLNATDTKGIERIGHDFVDAW
jgi:acetyl-CoA carboxylase carboxyltransferase component